MTIEEWHQRIAERPDDIDPRLVFADWLVERGDPRGDFIHYECRILNEPEHPDRRKWRLRANKLRKEHRKAWWGEHGYAGHGVRGGFLERSLVRCSVEVFDQLDRCAPALMAVSLTGAHDAEDPSALARHPLWRKVRRLDVLDLALPFAIAALEAESVPNLVSLRWVGYPGSPGNDARGRRLVELLAARDQPLNSLDLYRAPLGPEGIEILTAGELFRGIRELRLGETKLGVEGLEVLARCPHLSGLERLDIRRIVRGGSAGPPLHALAARCASLISLELMGLLLAPEDVTRFADHGGFPALSELSLHGCGLRDVGLARLLASQLVGQLTALNLRSNKLSDASATSLATTTALGSLKLLNLESNPLDRSALRRLATSPLGKQATITAGKIGNVVPPMTNEKAGVWLGSTHYRAKNVIASPKPKRATKRRRAKSKPAKKRAVKKRTTKKRAVKKRS